MKFQKILFGVVVSISLFFSFSAFAAEIPVGTLLYRTSPGGLMFGQNTNWLLSPFGKSWLNCGHVGMYIGDNQVIEAAEGKIQKIFLNRFVNLKIGEKFVGARIPKDFDRALGDKLKFIAGGQENEGYDSIFHQQKGQNSGEWTCVGFTEKIYESLKADYPNDLIYDSSKYYIDLIPDGFDAPENYQNSSCFTISKDQLASPQMWENGSPNCFSRTKEFSFLNEASVSLLASKIIGRKDDKNRGPYIFFPYTQFLSDQLKDVPIEPSLVSSSFDRPSENELWEKIKNTALDVALRTTTFAIKTEDKTKDTAIALSNNIKNFFANIFGQNEFKLAQVFDLSQDQNQQNQISEETGNVSLQESAGEQTFNEEANNQENEEYISPVKNKEITILTPTSTLKKPDKKETEEEKETKKKPESSKQTETTKFCSFSTSQAPSRRGIIINEIAWMGTTNSANDEWIELKNISNSEIDVSNWQLIDQAEQIKINLGLMHKTKVGPGGFILLERTDDNSVPMITADLIYSGALSNTDEGLRLFDSQCNLIDEVLANSDWPAGIASERRTMERKSDLSWQSSAQPSGTPKAVNSTGYIGSFGGGGSATASGSENETQPAKILINEIQLASLSNVNDEFVELYNPNNEIVDLADWYLQKETKSGTSSISTFAPKDLFLGKTIGPHQYLLVANASSTFSSSADILTKSTYGLADNNTLVLKNPSGDIVDKVGWGEAQDCEGGCALNPDKNQSIQRKFQDNTFVDIDNNASDFEIQTCPSPKAQSKNCSATNQAPSAFFVYAPLGPQAGEEINFNAASSSDPDGTIISYQWNFDDNATSSIATATTTHSYSQTGDYQVGLIVFDEQNASSTATSTTISVSSSRTNHIVISEILFDALDSDEGKEFIELYNSTDNDIDLKDWSLRILVGSATTTNSLVRFGSKSGDQTLIKNQGFLLVGLNNYSSTIILADLVRSASLSNSSSTLYLIDNNSDEIDCISYSDVISAGQSLERKAFSNNQCVSAQNENEFLGNGCDTDSDSDFEIRPIPNPQNSSSLPEPRNGPSAVQDFEIQYSSSTKELIFTWSPSEDCFGATSTVTYKITDVSQASSTLASIETASTTASITGISREEADHLYVFSIQSFDKEGLDSETTQGEITVLAIKRTILAQQLDDTAETGDDVWGDPFVQKLSLNPSEFQGTFNRIELKVFSKDGWTYMHSLWIREIDPNDPDPNNDPSPTLLFYTNYADFGIRDQWNTIVYDVGTITTKSDKIYEFAIRGRYDSTPVSSGLQVKGSANPDSYAYGYARHKYGETGSVRDLYFKIYLEQ